MPHCCAEGQAAWLKEIARLPKPEGVALITFGDRPIDPALDGTIPDCTDCRHTVRNADDARRSWGKPLDVAGSAGAPGRHGP